MIPIQRTCDVENIGDFNRYYQGSWVGWRRDEDKITPGYVAGLSDIDRVSIRPLLKQENGKFLIGGGVGLSWESLKDTIDFGTPEIGMVPDGPTVLYCSYDTPRVAKKGYRSRDPHTTDFNGYKIKKRYNPSLVSERQDWIWFAFNPEYPTLEQAEEKLTEGKAVGLPLSRTIGVYTLPSFQHSLLAYKRWTVGHVVHPQLIRLKREYADYEEDIARQTGAQAVVG
jgi:hypothetical protein